MRHHTTSLSFPFGATEFELGFSNSQSLTVRLSSILILDTEDFTRVFLAVLNNLHTFKPVCPID